MFSPCPLPSRFFGVLSRELMLRPRQIAANAEDAAFMIPAVAGFAARYEELRLPVTIIAGAEDRIVDIQAHSGRFHEAVPHSTLIAVSDAGHMVHYAAPDRVVSAIASLSQIPRGSPVLEAA
jgi:pimeloyl-ACP methyl ester carboxylesterase